MGGPAYRGRGYQQEEEEAGSVLTPFVTKLRIQVYSPWWRLLRRDGGRRERPRSPPGFFKCHHHTRVLRTILPALLSVPLERPRCHAAGRRPVSTTSHAQGSRQSAGGSAARMTPFEVNYNMANTQDLAFGTCLVFAPSHEIFSILIARHSTEYFCNCLLVGTVSSRSCSSIRYECGTKSHY